MIGRCSLRIFLWATAACIAVSAEGFAMDVPEIAVRLTPQPQQTTLGEGHFALRNGPWVVGFPAGPEHEACRSVVTTALSRAGLTIRAEEAEGNTFVIGQEVALPDLPTQGQADEAYVLRVTPSGVTARGASAAGLCTPPRHCGSCCGSRPPTAAFRV